MSTWGKIRYDLVRETGIADVELVSTWINEAYVDILDHRAWRALMLDFDVVTEAPYQTGTVAVTAGGVALAGTGTAWTEAMSGRQVFVGVDPLPYRFYFVSPTLATLDRPWQGATATGVGYRMVLAFFPVPINIKLVQWRRPKPEWGESLPVGRGLTPIPSVGLPDHWDAVDVADTGERFIRVSPAPDAAYLLTFTGQQAPVGFDGTNVQDSPLPFIQEDAIRWHVKGLARQHNKDKNGADAAFRMYANALARMARLDDARQNPQPLRVAGWMKARSIQI